MDGGSELQRVVLGFRRPEKKRRKRTGLAGEGVAGQETYKRGAEPKIYTAESKGGVVGE